MALCSDGTVVGWGRNSQGQLGDGSSTQCSLPVTVNSDTGLDPRYVPIRSIAAGALHSIALCDGGTVVAWGDNRHGQLGDGTTTDRTVPVLVNTPPSAKVHWPAGRSTISRLAPP